MTAQQLNVDNIANNLANANTTGYKIARAAVSGSALSNHGPARHPSASAATIVPAGLQLGLGTRAASNEIIFTQGSFYQTSNPLDIAIQGNGFFQVRLATGQLAYTRDGSFQLDTNGTMVAANGNPVGSHKSPSRPPRNISPSPPMAR